jgi:cytochrome c oxidase subunit 1
MTRNSAAPVLPKQSYLDEEKTVTSWFFTHDHKRIALLYLASITFFFVIGSVAAVLMRIELTQPRGEFFTSTTYNKLFTLHGVIMVWFFLIPAIPNVLGNFLIPMMIGARDMAFPRLNLLSWYVFMFGGLFAIASMLLGGVDTGWTFYTPYSSTYSNGWVIAMAVGIFINGFSSIFTGLNFIVTIHKLRAPGMTWFRLPLFIWTMYSTSLIFVLATPVLAITLTLVALERLFGVGIFDPRIGGDPLLFQHLFWFYSHPAVYIMVLPAMGVVSELIAAFSRKPVFGYDFVVYASLGIAFLGFLVWGHHMFVSGQSVYAGLIFSLLSFFVAIPSAIKVFNWTATLYKGHITFEAPMLYALSFIALFTIGGMTGLMLASLAVDVHVTQTYFVVAHFHYIMAVMAYLGGIHYWFPKITGRLYPERLAQLAAVILFVGFNLTFFPQFVLGYMGMPRRYHVYPEEFQLLNIVSTSGLPLLGIGYFLPLCYLGWASFFGRIAGPTPWRPPPSENFERTPIVTGRPYAYASPPDTHEPDSPPEEPHAP